MSDAVSLHDLHGAHRRTSSRIYRILEDGYDFAVDSLIIDTLDRDALIIDAGFFLLVFGQIDARLTRLAMTGLRLQEQRDALRQQRFERRLAVALPGDRNAELRQDIGAWSTIRNEAAHGQQLATGYAIQAIFEAAYQLDALLTDRIAALNLNGE